MAVLKDLIVHGPSRFLNGINVDKIEANAIKADSGIFNQLIATTLEAKNAHIDELTANNATVFGVMDVKGKLQTNQWEAANIANVGGNFYISPTGKSATGTVTITRTTAASGTTSAKYSVTMSGTFGVSTTSSTIWANGAYGMATGNVSVGTKKYPLGTCDGPLSGISTGTNTITGFTISNIESAALDIIFDENASLISSNAISSKPGADLQVSVYLGKSGNNYMPVGILLTSYGKDNKQYIDIYDGEHSAGTAITGFANPAVRIGDLSGLNSYTQSGKYTITPTGWGIYTTNGFFVGDVYAENGYIGGFTIGTNVIKNTKTSYSETTNNGVWLGTDGIGLGKGLFYVTNAGVLTAKSGTIGGWNISATALCSATTYTPGSGRILLAPAGVTSSAIGNLPAATYAITAGTNFGVTTAGTLYATGAQIKGAITVTSGSDLSAGLTNYSTTAQISNTYSTKADAVRRTQRIYYYAPSEGEGEESTESETLSAPETPNSWISVSSGVETWINQRIEEVPVGSGSETEPLSVENYPNVWVSEQTEMVNGDINCTPPKLDSISSIALDAQDLVNSLSDTINGENGLSEAIRLLTGSIIINPGDFTQTPPVEPSITIQTNSEEEGAETGKAALTLTSTQLILEKNDDAVITLDSTQDDGAIEANEIVLNSGLRIGNLEIIPYNGGIGIRAWEVEE